MTEPLPSLSDALAKAQRACPACGQQHPIHKGDCFIFERFCELDRVKARLEAAEGDRDQAKAELAQLQDFKALLAFVDDAGQPVMASHEQMHKHHADEPYIGCFFCRDQFMRRGEL